MKQTQATKKIKVAQSGWAHPTAVVEPKVKIGSGTKIWHFCHVRSGARLGKNVSLAKDVYVDLDVSIGDGSRIQNGVSIYHGVSIGKWCFVGPHVIFTNDQFPRAGNKNWEVTETHLRTGSSIGAGSIIRCGIEIGEFAMVGAGAVVTKSVPAFHLVMGLPARDFKMICACGQTQLPIGSPKKELLRPCCKKNLAPELLSLAQIIIRQLK